MPGRILPELAEIKPGKTAQAMAKQLKQAEKAAIFIGEFALTSSA